MLYTYNFIVIFWASVEVRNIRKKIKPDLRVPSKTRVQHMPKPAWEHPDTLTPWLGHPIPALPSRMRHWSSPQNPCRPPQWVLIGSSTGEQGLQALLFQVELLSLSMGAMAGDSPACHPMSCHL